MIYMGKIIIFIVGWILVICITELYMQGFFDLFWESLKNHFDELSFFEKYYRELIS